MTPDVQDDLEEVDRRPYAYSIKGALEAFPLSESRLRRLIRTEKLAVRYEGAKVLILGDSLRRYIDSLPSRRIPGQFNGSN